MGLALAVAGCAGEEVLLAAETRLADLVHPATAAWRRPTATLFDERRIVLTRHHRAPIVKRGAARVNPRGRMLLSVSVPPALRRAERLVLAPQRRIGDERWIPMEPWLVQRPDEGWPSKLPLELDLGLDRAGEAAWLVLEGIVPPGQPEQRVDVPAVRIPAGARLAFGIGIERAAWGQGPVRFAISLCRSGNCEERFAETLDPAEETDRGWHDRALDLGDLAGSDVSFRFDTQLLESGPDGFSLPVWSNPTVLVERARAIVDQLATG